MSKISLALSILIFAVVGLGYAAYRYYDGKLAIVSIHGPGYRSPAGANDQAQNFVLAGSDTRNFVGGNKFQAAPGSSDYVSGQRSDTVLLVHFPPGQARATIVSFPRDSYVQIPEYSDKAGGVHPAHMGKLNEAFQDGGAPLLVKLIEQLTLLRVDHYVQVDFAGFQKMVDAVGGVTLCVQTSRHDKDSGDYLSAGTHPLVNGATALAFVRDRKGLAAGDIDRIKDQQYFLSQMLKKTLSAGTLANPFTLNRFLSALTSSVTVDSEFGFAQIRTLATRLRHIDPAHVTFTTIPFVTESGSRTFEGARQSVVLLDPVADAALFARLRQDNQSTPSAAPTVPSGQVRLPPSQVSVRVRNATGTPGLAAATATQLRAAGFQVTDVGSVPNVPGTQIRYSPDRSDSAQTLAAAVPGATLVPDPTSNGLVELVLGNGPVTVQSVTAGSAPVPAPSAVTAAAAVCAP